MRLLLDAHVSGPKVGRRLRAKGHDVRALDQEPALEGLDDEDVLRLAADEGRILITHNVRDFAVIAREWASAQHTHAGMILIHGIDHSEFDLIVRVVERLFGLYDEPASWTDLAVMLDRGFASR